MDPSRRILDDGMAEMKRKRASPSIDLCFVSGGGGWKIRTESERGRQWLDKISNPHPPGTPDDVQNAAHNTNNHLASLSLRLAKGQDGELGLLHAQTLYGCARYDGLEVSFEGTPSYMVKIFENGSYPGQG
jgi:hypothetical protein